MLSRSILGVACRQGRLQAAAAMQFVYNGRKESLTKEQDDEIKEAAVEAAKSLPGNWTRTADDLMNRLAMYEKKDNATDGDIVEEKPKSMLDSMQVSRGYVRQKDKMERRLQVPAPDDPDVQKKVGDAASYRRRTVVPRTQKVFTKVYGHPPLRIFDPKNFKEEEVADEEIDLWREKDMNDLREIQGSLPRNAFEEMIQWTKEGKMWQYPIDNEADMHEERQYEFHEHVFLERHLDEFPSQGPLRRFMELVVLGLSKNPWVSVPEKMEHIRWFADYFREKQSLLEPTLGEQAKLKDVES